MLATARVQEAVPVPVETPEVAAETDGRGSPAEAENVAVTMAVALAVAPEVPS